MTHSGNTDIQDSYACPHCSALYAVTVHRFPTRDQGGVPCQCCRRGMVVWSGLVSPCFTLIAKPANDLH